MNRILTSELSEMSMGSSVVEASSNLSSARRVNPWIGKAAMSANAKEPTDGQSNASLHSHDLTVESSTEKLFETDAWPEPSVPFQHRVPVSSAGGNTADDKPKSKKLVRKWQNIEIEFATPRSSRGGVRMPSGVVNSNHHSPTSLPTSSSVSSTLRGSNRRGGPMSNGSFNRGRGGRPVNGYYLSCPSLRTSDPNVVQETLSDVSESNNTATAFVSSAPRGSYSSRGRRNGFRGTSYANASYIPKNYGVSVSQSNSSTSMAVPQQVSVATATAAAAPVIPPLPAVESVAYLFPNVVMPPSTVFPIPAITEAAVMNGDTASSQAAVLLPQPSPQACLISPVTTLPAPSNQLGEHITLDELLEFLDEYGWSKARIPNHFRRNPAVAAAMEAAVLVAAKGDEIKVEFSGDVASSAEKSEDIIVVDDKFYFVPLNSHLTKFIKLHSKQDYIRHHVEYYFSESNLQRDEHLMNLIGMNKYTCPLGALLNFNRLRYVNTSEDELIQSVMLSSTVSVVYNDQQRAVGVAPQNPSLLKAALATATSTANHSTSCDTTAHQTTQASDLQQPKSSEAESQVLMSIDSAGSLPFMLSNGISTLSVPGLPPNANHIFQHPQFLPFSSVPTLPFYYNTTALPAAIGSDAAGDHTFTMDTGGAAENANMYYRPLWPSPSTYPQAPTSFLPFFASQNQSFYVSLLQPNVAGLGPGVASVHNSMPRNPPPAFLPTPFAVPNAQLPTQQQRTFAAPVRAPHRPPSHRPINGDSKIIDEAEQNA